MTMRQQFPRQMHALEAVFGFLARFAEDNAVPPDISFVLNLAVEEFFTNMVKYSGAPDGRVDISAEKQNGRVIMVLENHDVDPFDVTVAKGSPTDVPLRDRPIGGLGIKIAREMLDGLDYSYANRTSRITLIKNLET